MKKFCSKCGNRLDLGKRTCTICNAFNPYFIAGFVSSDDSETSSNISENQANGQVLNQPVVKSDYAADLVRLRREQLEYQQNEFELKSELLKVKEETEQYKKETFELVTEVKKELHDIENENRLLKEKVELLKVNALSPEVQSPISSANSIKHKIGSTKGIVMLTASVLFIIILAVSWSYFSHPAKNTQLNTAGIMPTVSNADNKSSSPLAPKSLVGATQKQPGVIAVSSVPKSISPNQVTQAPVVKKSTAEGFTLTESKLKTDLVGKKLSGCDITINNASEINSITNLVLVDRLSASYLKYKCLVKIKQGNDVYTSSPYVYYSAEGSLIKVDGTNCE